MLKILPETNAFAPTFILKRFPVAVVEDPGDQSKLASWPDVKAVEVEDSLSKFPAVNELDWMSMPLPVFRELAAK